MYLHNGMYFEEDINPELTPDILARYLAHKYLYLTELRYPQSRLVQGENEYVYKLDKNIKNMIPTNLYRPFRRYIKDFWNKGIRDEYILDYTEQELKHLEDNYDIPKRFLEIT